MDQEEKTVGLFASLSPPIFIERAKHIGKQIPMDTRNHPLLGAHKLAEEPCDLFKTNDTELTFFGCECVVLDLAETEDILDSDLDIMHVTAKRYKRIQEEVFNGETG